MENIARAPFRVGLKEVFLPNFTVTFLRTKRLAPTHARFIVPLSMNKLDMRDYLYHAYSVKTLSVRSFIEQQSVRQGKPGSIKPQIKRWYRPQAKKYMTVELEQPFVWPETPKGDELQAWNNETFHKAKSENDEYGNRRGRLADAMYSSRDRKDMREQAQRLLEGKEKWRAGA